MSPVDPDMVLVAKGGDRDIDAPCAVLGRLGLRKLDRPTAGLPSTIVRVSASRKFQIEFA